LIHSCDNILVLAAHPDDAEFGMGGTIAQMVRHGAEVIYVAFSACEVSIPPEYNRNTLRGEFADALGLMRITGDLLDFPVRHLPSFRQDVLENMIKVRGEHNPDLVFIPATGDVHQDHEVIHNEGIRAFKQTSILGYHLPWNNFSNHPTLFVELSERDLDAKLAAIAAYKTQAGRSYSDPDYIRALAKVTGQTVGVDNAESFEVIRWIS